VTIGLEFAPGSCSQTHIRDIYMHTDAEENITSHHFRWGGKYAKFALPLRTTFNLARLSIGTGFPFNTFSSQCHR